MTLRRDKAPGERGMKVLLYVGLAAWGMLFLSLALAQAFLRGQAPSWPPDGAPPLWTGREAQAGALFALAAGLLWGAWRTLHRGGSRPLAALLWALGGAAALAGAGLEVWVMSAARATRLKDEMGFGSTHRSFLLLHAGHVLLAAPGFVTVFVRTLKRRYLAGGYSGPWAWSLYLTFSATTWALMFALVHLGAR